MIAGTVNAHREAVVSLRVKGSNGQVLDCDAIVDTGYSGSLSLPARIISALQLQKSGVVRALLADGSETVLDVAGDILIGTALLAGYQLRISFVAQGGVEIGRLP